jgi:hypothetical protein
MVIGKYMMNHEKDRYLSYVKVGIRNPVESLDSNGKD